MFLSCDMPFVSSATIQRVIAGLAKPALAVFFQTGQVVGFPFGLKTDTLLVVENQLRRRTYSLQALAQTLKAKRLRMARKSLDELFNINSPEDYELAQRKPLKT